MKRQLTHFTAAVLLLTFTVSDTIGYGSLQPLFSPATVSTTTARPEPAKAVSSIRSIFEKYREAFNLADFNIIGGAHTVRDSSFVNSESLFDHSSRSVTHNPRFTNHDARSTKTVRSELRKITTAEQSPAAGITTDIIKNLIQANLKLQEDGAYQYGAISGEEILGSQAGDLVQQEAVRASVEAIQQVSDSVILPIYVKTNVERTKLITVLEAIERLGGMTSIPEIQKAITGRSGGSNFYEAYPFMRNAGILLETINHNQRTTKRLQFKIIDNRIFKSQLKIVLALIALNGRGSSEDIATVLDEPRVKVQHAMRQLKDQDIKFWNANLNVLGFPEVQIVEAKTKRAQDAILFVLEQLGGFASIQELAQRSGYDRVTVGRIVNQIDFNAINAVRSRQGLTPIGIYKYNDGGTAQSPLVNSWNGRPLDQIKDLRSDESYREAVNAFKRLFHEYFGGFDEMVPKGFQPFKNVTAPWLYYIIRTHGSGANDYTREAMYLVFQTALGIAVDVAKQHGLDMQKIILAGDVRYSKALDDYFRTVVPRAVLASGPILHAAVQSADELLRKQLGGQAELSDDRHRRADFLMQLAVRGAVAVNGLLMPFQTNLEMFLAQYLGERPFMIYPDLIHPGAHSKGRQSYFREAQKKYGQLKNDWPSISNEVRSPSSSMTHAAAELRAAKPDGQADNSNLHRYQSYTDFLAAIQSGEVAKGTELILTMENGKVLTIRFDRLDTTSDPIMLYRLAGKPIIARNVKFIDRALPRSELRQFIPSDPVFVFFVPLTLVSAWLGLLMARTFRLSTSGVGEDLRTGGALTFTVGSFAFVVSLFISPAYSFANLVIGTVIAAWNRPWYLRTSYREGLRELVRHDPAFESGVEMLIRYAGELGRPGDAILIDGLPRLAEPQIRRYVIEMAEALRALPIETLKNILSVTGVKSVSNQARTNEGGKWHVGASITGRTLHFSIRSELRKLTVDSLQAALRVPDTAHHVFKNNRGAVEQMTPELARELHQTLIAHGFLSQDGEITELLLNHLDRLITFRYVYELIAEDYLGANGNQGKQISRAGSLQYDRLQLLKKHGYLTVQSGTLHATQKMTELLYDRAKLGLLPKFIFFEYPITALLLVELQTVTGEPTARSELRQVLFRDDVGSRSELREAAVREIVLKAAREHRVDFVPRVVFFDFGGVLAAERGPEFANEVARKLLKRFEINITQENQVRYEELLSTIVPPKNHPDRVRLMVDKDAFPEFTLRINDTLRALGAKSGLSEDDFAQIFFGSRAANESVKAEIQKLRQIKHSLGITFGVISNFEAAGKPYLLAFLQEHFGDLFDPNFVFVSGELGYSKSQKAAFDAVVDQLRARLSAKEVQSGFVLIDNDPQFLAAAQSAGFKDVHYSMKPGEAPVTGLQFAQVQLVDRASGQQTLFFRQLVELADAVVSDPLWKLGSLRWESNDLLRQITEARSRRDELNVIELTNSQQRILDAIEQLKEAHPELNGSNVAPIPPLAKSELRVRREIKASVKYVNEAIAGEIHREVLERVFARLADSDPGEFWNNGRIPFDTIIDKLLPRDSAPLQAGDLEFFRGKGYSFQTGFHTTTFPTLRVDVQLFKGEGKDHVDRVVMAEHDDGVVRDAYELASGSVDITMIPSEEEAAELVRLLNELPGPEAAKSELRFVRQPAQDAAIDSLDSRAAYPKNVFLAAAEAIRNVPRLAEGAVQNSQLALEKFFNDKAQLVTTEFVPNASDAKLAHGFAPRLGFEATGAARLIVQAANGKPVVFIALSPEHERMLRDITGARDNLRSVGIFRIEQTTELLAFLKKHRVTVFNIAGLLHNQTDLGAYRQIAASQIGRELTLRYIEAGSAQRFLSEGLRLSQLAIDRAMTVVKQLERLAVAA